MELVEREQPLAQLTEHLSRAAAGHGRLVLVGGEAGVGKTVLVDAFARGSGTTVLRMSCDALSTPAPLGPIRDLAPLLSLDIGERPLDSEGRERLFREVLAALAARPEPTVVIGEDAHWADGATLELFRFLGRRIDGLRTLLVVTYRDDEIGPDHPLRLVLGDLATASTVHRISLLPLSEEAVRHITAEAGGDATALHRLTGGNPFFLTEVLATAGETVPVSVEDAVLARASRLSPEARATLDVAAVIGSSIDPDLLLTVAGPVLDEVDECIARGLLRATGDSLAFRHELTRVAILGAIAPIRLRLLHARVLHALGAAPEGGVGVRRKLAQLAHHAEAAGDREAVLQFAVAAAEQAVALYAHREAAAQYARALRFGDGLPAADRARLLEALSLACYLSDQGEQAIAARRAALEIWRRLRDPLKEGESLRWLSRLSWYDGHGAEAESTALAALEVLEPLGPGPELAMAYSNLAQLRMLGDDLDETLKWGHRAINLAEDLGETETLVHALANVGAMRLNAGDDSGEEDLARSLRLALDAGFIDHAGRALTNLAWGALRAMRLDEAEHRVATALDYTAEHDLDNYRWYLLATRAAIRVRRGEWDASEADAQAVLKHPLQSPARRVVALAALGRIAARRGDPSAFALLDEALALAERSGQPLRLEPVLVVRAEAVLLENDPARARAELAAVRDLVFARGNPWQRGEVAWLLWQAGEREIPPDRLAAPYALLIGGDVAGAAVAWRDLGCPYEEARALAASDDPDAVRRAIATFERLDAQPAFAQSIQRLRSLDERDIPVVRRGPISTTRSNPAGLTQREVEVLLLVAEGLRNPEIAERLYLTPKTVSHHLTSVYGKLGVATRTEAARVAARLGITSES